jgi:hypothetical protein
MNMNTGWQSNCETAPGQAQAALLQALASA